MTLDTTKCIHCKKCTNSCVFLSKYDLDISDIDKLNELSYHCFLCGKCTEVCPVEIDGREVILNMRRKEVMQNSGKVKGYGLLRVEKENYIFKNYKHTSGKSLLFPGCNFPSFYPETTKKLHSYLNKFEDIGIAYDCCGKPIGELGKDKAAGEIIDRLNRRFEKLGVTELIVVCPNCYYYLKPHINIRVVSIYKKLEELGCDLHMNESVLNTFIPCPDRYTKEWLREIQAFTDGELKEIPGVQCCGLGGLASAKEPELAKGLLANLREKNLANIYTYCGTCAGNMARADCGEVKHFLVELLQSNEKADCKKSIVNRAKTRLL
ncbi:MAG: heterodisulfide reductase-related iron-sulfur binding cluster [Suipraeoptans sp.]